IFSNCHINLGRKNKMGEATKMLDWIDGRTISKVKFDAMSEEERKGLFPLGVLHKDDSHIEYTKAYQKVIEAAQNKTAINFEEIK
ncbi:MAG: 2-oxoglutarate ferredoxin oxidoreductase subunit beta, partial [Campylobacter sp.]|nr:2-oxoglutarate ferredoxin oxidoreductase subunit beta [Campylobacter sp.]